MAKEKAKSKSKNPAHKRDYKRERQYDGRPDVKEKRAARNRARRKAEKEGKVKKGDGKDVDHVTPLRKNSKSTKTRVISANKNRSWRKGKKGYD
jgi:hypothetical protein